MPHQYYKKLFSFRKSATILKSNVEEQIKAKYQDVLYDLAILELCIYFKKLI